MKVVILAAGEGTRMRPLTKTKPKPMIEVLGKPIIEHIFKALPKDVTEVIVVTKYLGEQIKSFLGDNFYGFPVVYVDGSSEGTAYSFLNTKKHIPEGEKLMVIYGDELPHESDIKACVQNEHSILCWEAEDPWNHGVLNVGDDDIVLDIVEKPSNPEGNLIVGGVMVLSDKIFSYYPDNESEEEFYLTDIIKEYTKNHSVKAVKSVQSLGGVSRPEDIARVEKILKEKI